MSSKKASGGPREAPGGGPGRPQGGLGEPPGTIFGTFFGRFLDDCLNIFGELFERLLNVFYTFFPHGKLQCRFLFAMFFHCICGAIFHDISLAPNTVIGATKEFLIDR